MSDWVRIPLDELVDVIDPHPSHRAPDAVVQGIPFVGIGDIREDGSLIEGKGRIVSEKIFDEHIKRYQISDRTIGFGRVATIGKVISFRNPTTKFVVSPTMAVLEPKPGTNRDFILHALQSEDIQEQIDKLLTGSTRSSLGIELLRKLTILHPASAVAQKISNVLNSVSNQIGATQALIDKYTAIKQGMMADLFSRGIDPETKALRPTFEEAPELYHETPLGMLPNGWDVKTLGDISEKITSGSRDWAKFYSSEGDLFVRISNLTREHVNFRWDSVKYVDIGGGSEGERTQLQPGDILVSITADLGIVGVVPEDMGRAYINQHTALIRLSTDGENARFIGNYLSSRRGQEQFEKNNDSGAKAGINLPTIASLCCPTPEGKEQILIASKIDALDEVIADLKREKSKNISLKQGLMQDLLTGQVSVPA
ncbi:Type I restriction-modification system, specificity subunit S [Photobacterium marinum]|uniref:Type I restriction-modification system, specificity subunit S n=1 Tax=Photobacterium marinum TaxID=1056511 RepID=L8JB92_9GAMM|nr:restriction endonuclease subunit S [Photobacterium marinum]ELR66120.1 Type I restriction-modification system, specificity subunit S [Photobacterium marinum]